ncbi:MAG: hypothetical protein L0387_22000 [Acidobacteria bacterium]|nr:hypothetical protein [Acidobacteriota bacterium]
MRVLRVITVAFILHASLTTPAIQSAIANRKSAIHNAHSESRNPKSAGRQPEPWYDRVLRRINPSNFDYGTWVEDRRMALLRASAQNPYFWYSTLVTVAMALFLLAYAKSRSDFHKYTWVSAGWLADFYNETQLARNEMDRAIEKHNRHIEKCNRAIEAEADGSWTRQDVNEEAALWRQKYDEAARALEEAVANSRKLEVTLHEKEAMVADMSLRIQRVERKIGDAPQAPSGAALTINESNKHLIGRINMLERQLREEQARNKSLKGRA